jgi:polysaccharide chain length determinant protein (PEP-CTERM system associated)
MDLGFYFKLLLRRLHYVLFFLAIGTAAGLSLALLLPPSYSSSATLLVESEQIPGELAATTVQTEAVEALEIIRQRILTRARLLELANQYQIYGPPSGEQRRRLTPDAVVDDLRSRITIRTTAGGDRRTAGATIVSVGFTAPAGQMAADVTNEIVRQILEENVTLRRGASSDTLAFFEDEVKRLDRELARREAELLAFREQNLDALPDSLDFRRSQQASLVERVLQLQRLEAALLDRRERLVTLFETTGTLLNQQQDRPRTENEVQLQQLRNRLAVARSVMSDSNPQMVILQSQVDALQAIVAEEQAALAGNTSNGDVQLSAFEIQLADIDAQIQASSEERARLTEELEALQASISATPANSIRLQTMQRDYDAVRTQYERAVSNRAAAQTGDVIENLSKGQRISVLEPAIAPSDPTSPNRPLIAAGGVAMGGAVGLGLVVLLELLNSSIRRPKDLETRLGIRAFGTVPLMRTPGQARRRQLVILTALLVVAIGIPTALFYVHTNVMPLDLALTRVARLAGLDNLPLPF